MLWLNWGINKFDKMKKEYSKIYEMFKTLNPDFRVKINEDETFSSTFDTPTIDSNNNVSSAVNNSKSSGEVNNSSIVDDNTLTVGELKTAIGIVSKAKNKDEAIKIAKSIGVDVLKCTVGLIGVGAVVFSGGVVAAVAGGAAITAGSVASTGHDTFNVFKKIFAPQQKGGNKEPNEFMKLLQIDNEVSVLLDDKIEYAFIDFAVNLLNSLPDTDPVPDFFEKLKEFIKEKYATLYNLTKN